MTINPNLKEIMDYYGLEDEKKVRRMMADCLVAMMSSIKFNDMVDELFKDASPEYKFKIHFCFSELQRNAERQKKEINIQIPSVLKNLAH